jgi:two-component system sensor histidine kinase KdpD
MNKHLFKVMPIGRQYLLSITLIGIVSLLCYLMSGFMGYRVTALVLLLSVSILAVIFDILPVLFSAALSAFIWDFFFIPPRFTVHVDNTEDAILLTMYFIIAMVNAVLSYKIRQIEKKAREREEKANSVKLYNTILNSLSHELRTPISAIIGASDNLLSNRQLTEENREQLISEISKASLRLNQQVENLLNISRLESGHIKPNKDWCDISELVYEVVNRVEENNPGRTISIGIKPDLPLCRTDEGMLHQILYNLLNNAAIHTSEACRIEITVSCLADRLHLVIEDNGPGFDKLKGDDIFHKFSSQRSLSSSGSGLGLSIVRGFTEALGGTVSLDTSRKTGARFIVSIPVETNHTAVTQHE